MLAGKQFDYAQNRTLSQIMDSVGRITDRNKRITTLKTAKSDDKRDDKKPSN